MAGPDARRFEAYDPATGPLKEMPLLIGITGPSFSGKSYSAERLAHGIQRVYGGTIYHVDTENDRALELHPRYGGPFTFQHIPFPMPKSPAEYEEVLRFCLSRPDVGVIILDQCTHEHVALLNMMEEYMQRKGIGDDYEKREKAIFASMVVPKAQRKRFNELAAFGAQRPDGRKVPVIYLYRGQDKTKPTKKTKVDGEGRAVMGRDGKAMSTMEIVHKGWQAETSSDLPYYMTARFLLPPGSDGHPNLAPDTEWERLAMKNPQQFRGWFRPGFQLTEEIGERLARWAKGLDVAAAGAPAQPPAEPQARVDRKALLAQVGNLLEKHCGSNNPQRSGALQAAFGTDKKGALEKMPDEAFAVGLTALRTQLEGLAAMKSAARQSPEPDSQDEWPPPEPDDDTLAREPGEED